MEILAALIVFAATVILFVILFFGRKRNDTRRNDFFVNNGLIPADDYAAQLPTIEGKDLVWRSLGVKKADGSRTEVHWCEYKFFTHEYTSHSNKLYINYSIITFPKQIASADFTEKISRQIDRSDERFKGNMMQRIRKDSERPTDLKVLPNGDLATFWTSRNNVEDLEYKLKWIKENLG